jgi:pyruvate dehydrogenase E1 component alpha subunit
VFLGDGAFDEGVLHESLNLAVMKQVPVLFVCENNELAVHSRREARQAFSLPTTGPYYGMNYGVYMGQDAVDVMIATEAALTKIRIDKKPFLIMFNTYRYREHVGVGEDFTAGYRSRTELQFPQAQDPVEILARRLDPGVVMAIDKSIEEEIALALQFAEESPFPEPFEKLSDVYL